VSTNERIKRPLLERSAPIRNWSTLLNAGSPGAAPPGGGAGANSEGASGLADAISRSVALGYQVVEEYVRQGERAARRMTSGGYRTDGTAVDAQDLVQRMGQYASELVGTWLELVQRTAAVRPAPDGAGAAAVPPTVVPNATAVPTARSSRVRVAVRCSRPVEVAVELMPEAADARLVVHGLRACEAWKPRLGDVQAIAAGDDAPLLSVRVPDGHPPGTYEGLIVDESTNRPVGVLCVTIRGGDAPPG